jgi:hypothetical protein
VGEHPLREHLWALLITARYRSGRQAEALAAYQAVRSIMVSELGLEPGDELQRLEQAVLHQDPCLDGVRQQGPAPPSSDLPAALRTSGPVLGRGAELSVLQGALDEGRPAVVVRGEAGIGKTSLVGAFAEAVHADGGRVLYGACTEVATLPFQPVAAALRRHLDVQPDALDVLGASAHELVRLVPDREAAEVGTGQLGDLDLRQHRLFDAVLAWLQAVAREQPTILVLDDLHWAGVPMAGLLEHLLTADMTDRPLVVVTYRDDEVEAGHPVATLVAGLGRTAPGAEVIDLTGLGPRAVTELVNDLAPRGEPVPDALISSLCTDTGGNPLFVRELVRDLVDQGTLDGASPRLPANVRDVIARRIDRLTPAQRAVLEAAAVLGPEFEPAGVAAVAGVPDADVLDAVEVFLALRLIGEDDGVVLRHRFTHDLVRKTTINGLTATRRARLNAAAATWLFGRVAEGDDVAATTAAHAEQAGGLLPPAEVARMLTLAGDAAMRQLAVDGAIDWYERALPFTERDPSARLDVLLALGAARRWQGERRPRATFREAADLAQVVNDPIRLATAVLGMGRGSFSRMYHQDAELIDRIEAALAALPEGNDALRGRLLAALAAELVFDDPDGRRFSLSDEALALARRSGDASGVREVLMARLTSVHALVDVDRRVTESEELVERTRVTDDHPLIIRALFSRILVLEEVPDLAGVDAVLAEIEEYAENGLHAMVDHAQHIVGAWRSMLDGRLADAERHAFAGLASGQAAGDPDTGLLFGAQLVGVRRLQGRLAELARTAELDEVDFPANRPYLARLQLEAGNEAAARARWPSVTEVPVEEMTAIGQLAGMALVCRSLLAARFDDAAEAERLLPWVDQVADRLLNPLEPQPIGHHVAGVLEAALGDLDGAEERLAQAVDVHRRLGAPVLEAMSRTEWAKVILRHGGAARRRHAESLIADAIAAAELAGADGVRADASAVMATG